MANNLPVFERLADEVDMAEERAARQEPAENFENTNAIDQNEQLLNPVDYVIHEENESEESD